MKKNILLTNDDGFDAQGMNILYNHLSQIFNVTVSAPKHNNSGKSHAITLQKDISVQKYNKGLIVDGTPVDCIYLGLGILGLNSIDLVVSGINEGYNLGDDFHYSGTISAAREAAFYNVPAIALSMGNCESQVIESHCKFITTFIENNFENFIPGIVESFNFPEIQTSVIEQSELGFRNRETINLELYSKHKSDQTLYRIGKLNKGTRNDFNIINSQKISRTTIDYRFNRLGEYMSHK